MIPNPLNENNSPMIVNGRYQPIIIALYVEDYSIVRNDARILIAALYISGRGPFRCLCLMEPGVNRRFHCFVILAASERLRELKQRTARNHSHVLCRNYYSIIHCAQNGHNWTKLLVVKE